MKDLWNDLSKYQKQAEDKIRQLKLKEKLSSFKVTEILDRAKVQYSDIDKKLKTDKMNMSLKHKRQDKYDSKQPPFDIKAFTNSVTKNMKLNDITKKMKNMDIEDIKNKAANSVQTAKRFVENFAEKSKEALNDLTKSNTGTINKNAYSRNPSTNGYNNHVQVSKDTNSYPNTYNPNYSSGNDSNSTGDKQRLGESFKNWVRSKIPERQRTGYDIYIDNFSNSSRFGQIYKKSIFVRGYRTFKSNIFWKTLLFCSVVTFAYSYAKHLAMGRAHNQQFERFIDMQKQLNETLQNQKKDS